MEENPNYFSQLKNEAKVLIQEKLLLFKLKAVKHIAMLSAGIMVAVVSVVLAFFFLLFLGITIGFFLGKWLGSMVAAFAIVTVLYLIGMFALFAARRFIGRMILMTLINWIFRKKKKR